VRFLRLCVAHWKKVSAITNGHYREVPYIDHLGYGKAYHDARTFSWSKYQPQAERDVKIAQGE
jgi:hypothetical protein